VSVPRTALIVGAGIGGLAAAVALRRAGWHVRVFERAASPRELGFALNLAPNAMAALRELQLAEPLLAEGHVPVAMEFRRTDGRVLRRLDAGPLWEATAAPTVIALRPALHGALLSAIGPDALVLGSEAAGFEVDGEVVELTATDGRAARGDVLIGADGLRSTIRKLLHPNEPPPRRSGYWALRGVGHDVAHHLGTLCGAAYFGPGIEAATVRASRTAVYWYMSLLAGDVPPETRDPAVVLERCAAVLDRPFRAIADATRPADLRLDELFDREPIDRWGRGPVTLLGDAAHPMLPHTGQGAAQALEDAVALGLALGRNEDGPAALRLYERVRGARTRRIVRSGRRIARITTTRNRAIGWLRDTAIGLVPVSTIVAAYQLGGRRDPHLRLR
jgi:2-polyprenyl-6-methoxyphenol hydroxylase-like FAD-dependent oxidoreductase